MSEFSIPDTNLYTAAAIMRLRLLESMAYWVILMQTPVTPKSVCLLDFSVYHTDVDVLCYMSAVNNMSEAVLCRLGYRPVYDGCWRSNTSYALRY